MKDSLMLYLHMPFCVKKCHYCDFLSFVCDEEARGAYVGALCEELRVRGGEMKGRTVSSVFFGGGTPSLLSPAQISEIMTVISEIFVLTDDAEITMECNPGTIHGEAGYKAEEKARVAEDAICCKAEEKAHAAEEEELAKLAGYRAAGVNRLSIGLQSMQEEELELLGRIHDREAFLRTYELARKAGFSNVNVDLMNALPGQTLETWKDTLESVLALAPQPEHLSVYSLILEEGTTFAAWEKQGRFTGRLAIPSEDADREMYAYTGKRLAQAGYQQYEISNYSKPGHACRHNLGYWTRKEYLGLGLGAASLLSEVRYSNETRLENYLGDPLAGRQEEALSRKAKMEEFAFLGLRTTQGVSRETFRECFHDEIDQYWHEVIQRNVADGLLLDDGETIRLTAKGMDLGNYVSAQFLLDD